MCQQDTGDVYKREKGRSKESRISNVWTVCVSNRLLACSHTCFQ